METSKPKRRWFHYSLRTMFLVVGIAAVVCWAYWIGWPTWRNHREQVHLENLVRRLRVGISTEEDWNFHAWPRLADLTTSTSDHNLGKQYVLNCFRWPNVIYVVYYIDDLTSNKYVKVEAFRVRPPPRDYVSKTIDENARDDFDDDEFWVFSGFLHDFGEFLKSDRKVNPGFEYEMIYADPPGV